MFGEICTGYRSKKGKLERWVGLRIHCIGLMKVAIVEYHPEASRSPPELYMLAGIYCTLFCPINVKKPCNVR